MPIYHTLGSIPKKRHTAFRKPNGGIYAEELMGHEGFTGTSALLYHVHPPTTVKSVRRVRETVLEADPDQALRHRHFRTARAKKGGSPTLDRIPILTAWELVEGPGAAGSEVTVRFGTEPTHPVDRLHELRRGDRFYRRQWSTALSRLKQLIESGRRPERVVIAGGARAPVT